MKRNAIFIISILSTSIITASNIWWLSYINSLFLIVFWYILGNIDGCIRAKEFYTDHKL